MAIFCEGKDLEFFRVVSTTSNKTLEALLSMIANTLIWEYCDTELGVVSELLAWHACDWMRLARMSCTAKLFYCILLNRIQDPVERLPRSNQHSFRLQRSTLEPILALWRLIETISAKKELTLRVWYLSTSQRPLTRLIKNLRSKYCWHMDSHSKSSMPSGVFTEIPEV